MRLSPVFLQQFANTVQRILHVPGNYNPSRILEMTVVLDTALEQSVVSAVLPKLLLTLKKKDKIFQNVRLNLVQWKPEGMPDNQVCPMMQATLESFYRDYSRVPGEKSLEELAEYLRLFQARAKLILLITDGTYQMKDPELVKQRMQPFLERKLLEVRCGETGEEINAELHYREW